MLTEYIKAAMATAVFKVLDDTPGIYGHLTGCPGVWALEVNEAACRAELESVLDDWVLLHIRLGDELPTIAGISIAPPVLV